jgi:hypothetical protein
MKGKYITLNIRLASAKRRSAIKKDIYAQLEETIAERKRILQQLERYTETANTVRMIISGAQAA